MNFVKFLLIVLWSFCLLKFNCGEKVADDDDDDDGDKLNRTRQVAKSLNDAANNQNDGKVLSRRRRYLTFPDGSSLQVVYDQTIPIVGIERLYTIGVTVALAYELPSEPLYKIAQQLRDKLKQPDPDIMVEPADPAPADSKSRIDKFSNKIEYVDAVPYPAKINEPIHIYKNPASLQSWDKLDYNPYYGNPPPQSSKLNYYLNDWKDSNAFNTPANQYQYFNSSRAPSAAASLPPYNWNQHKLFGAVNSMAQKLNLKRIQSVGNNGYRKPVVPIFGKKKRSLEEDIEREEQKLFNEYHRQTRHRLYQKIEKYVNSHGRDGRTCVLKALCETGQRHHERGTGTFVGEIMRTIFTLPKYSEETPANVDKNHIKYDEAHGHGPEQNCDKLYPECKESVWSADFIF